MPSVMTHIALANTLMPDSMSAALATAPAAIVSYDIDPITDRRIHENGAPSVAAQRDHRRARSVSTERSRTLRLKRPRLSSPWRTDRYGILLAYRPDKKKISIEPIRRQPQPHPVIYKKVPLVKSRNDHWSFMIDLFIGRFEILWFHYKHI